MSKDDDKKKALTKYDPRHLRVVTDNVYLGDYTLDIPTDAYNMNLTDTNKAAYTLLKHALFDLRPNDIKFLGTMSGANFITPKQRKYLADLLKRHLDITLADA